MLIWYEERSEKNTFVAFRKSFIKRDDTTLKIAVDGKYYLWINNRQVIYEGGLNRGGTPNSGYYDVFDLVPYLKQGTNTLAVLVWYWGNGGRNNVFTERAGLLTEGAIVTDESFKCKHLDAYFMGGPPYPAYLYGGYNISFNANLDIGNWMSEDYDDREWQSAVPVSIESWGTLEKRPIPMIKEFGMKEFTNAEISFANGFKTITTHLPYAAWVSPYIKINALGNEKIDIRTDRYTVNGGPGDEHHLYNGQRCEYIAKVGVQSFESVNPYFGEQVIFTMPETVEVMGIKYRETGYNCEFDGKFVCDDEDLNTLFKKCRRTLYVCMRDNFMDCPDRERGQWIGDVSVQAPQVFYCLSRSADALLKKAIYDFINWREDNVLKGNVPGYHCSELPSQSLNAISSIGMIKEYYMHTGDKSILEFAIEPIVDYLLLCNMGKDGLVAKRNGDWAWYDHGANIDERVLENSWYLLALDFALSIRYNGELENRRKMIRDNFNAAFWKEDGYRSGDFLDDRANAMAYLSGFASEEKIPIIANVLKSVYNATPYMENYVLEALFDMGYEKDAVERMKKRYMPLIKNNNTTLWEDFEVLGTKNHAWSGGPLTHMFKWITGIKPLKPGYEEFTLKPYLGHLSYVEAVVPSVKGDIHIKIDKSGVEVTGENIINTGTSYSIG